MSNHELSILREVERCLRLGLRYAGKYPAAQTAGYDAVRQRQADMERMIAIQSLFSDWLQAQRPEGV